MNLNNNNHNNNHKNCGFAEDAAAFLYGEIEKREKVNFETHLAKCDSCVEEFADFTMLRSGIADWKMKNFDVLATPVIEIPYEQTVEIKTETVSWFDSLKNLLTFSPAMATVAAAIVLALFAGLGFLIFSSNTEELASNQIEKIEVAPPVIENKISDEKSSVKPDVAETNEDLPETNTGNNGKTAPEIITKKVSDKPQPVKIASETPNKIKNIEPKRKSDNLKTTEENSPVQAQKLPKLNTLPDDEEVNELSLSDLLADVDSK